MISPAITYSQDNDGVGWLVFAEPSGRANVFTREALAAFETALAEAEHARPKAMVVTGGHDRIFVAGADLQWLAALPDRAAATELSRRGQQLFERLNRLPAPVVCAIHGACAGGGFELALACHWRMATDAPVTRIGLPETGIGTIPGWGGSVRLPRLVGIKAALEHILKAELIGAREALDAGFVHAIVPPDELRARARAAALRLAAEHMAPPALPPSPLPGYFGEVRERIRARFGDHQPALLAAIDVVEQTSQLSIPAALEIEARRFGEVTAGEACRNMIHAFFVREAAKKRTLDGWFAGPAFVAAGKPGQQPVLPRRIGVIGAGVMGSGLAHWIASRDFEVVLRDISGDLLERGLQVVRGLFNGSVKRGKLSAGAAAAALGRIRTTTGWDGFDACELVIEAIVEDAAAKRQLFGEIAAVAPGNAILASNTSALPLEEIAAHVANPWRTVGIHFFNPVSRMPLVELILGRQTSADTAERALAFVKALGKSPVICRSSPGFLVTRVLFFYLNEAVRLWEQGLATSAIDAALREFGWPMGPLRLIDEVGVDVSDFIFGEMGHYFPDRFTRTTACARMAAAGWRGRKGGAGAGFYTHAAGEAANDAETRRLIGRLGDLALDGDEITERLMRVMVDEAERCLAEGVVRSPEDVDFALLAGAGFPVFRGGLLRWAWTRTGVPT